MMSEAEAFTFLTIDRQGAVAVVTIHRPPMNALSNGLLQELKRAAAALAASDASVVVLTGEGKAFVAGADIAEMQAMDPLQARQYGMLGQSVFFDLEGLPQPVIAAVNGYALGGGCELAMACDLRIAADAAVFGQPEVGLAVIPGFGGTQRLARLVGVGKAKELIYTGETLPAAEALRIGLVNRVVTRDALIPEAVTLGNAIAAKGQVAVRLAKRAIGAGMEAAGRSGFALEAELLGQCFATADKQEGMRAFLEKRKPAFTGR
jgi:enoyl-CoA hydratase